MSEISYVLVIYIGKMLKITLFGRGFHTSYGLSNSLLQFGSEIRMFGEDLDLFFFVFEKRRENQA